MSPTNPDDARYTLTELADLAGVTPRTVRYYLAQGLLPAVGVSGPGAKYDDAHLARLRLIRRLQAQHLPLADIRRQLDTLDDAAALAIAAAPDPGPPPDSAIDYIRRVTAATDPPASGPFAISRPADPQLRRSFDASTAPAAPAPAPAAPASAPAMPPPAPAMPVSAPPAPHLATGPTPRIDRSQWERVAVDPDVEIHLRRPLSRSTAKRVDRLIEIARDLFKENEP
jgi:DNA-binding transcriptional MerR regulator